jgi:alpha-tubulin suppressor-like RCC1 family protein
VLDEHGRIRTLGDNKYGQLGHKVDCNISNNAEPQLVDGPLGQIDSGCFTICCGWSHILALTRDENGVVALYGWGKNNMGQLGVKSSNGYSSIPQVLDPSISIQSACCGAESSHVLASDGNIYSTGWNEHGNLAIGCDYETSSECCLSWVATTGAKVVAPPPSKTERKIFAAGGAHIITCAK